MKKIALLFSLLILNPLLAQIQLGADIDGEAPGDLSGRSVSITSDGSIVAIGAAWNNGNGSDAGHVRVYEYSSGSWTQLGSDIDGGAGDCSGYSVSLSSDGTIIAIGAIFNDGNGSNSGTVRVYEYSSGSWTQRGSDIGGEAANDWSGFSVSLSNDGTRVAIGAPHNDGNGSNAGHVRVYEYSSVSWTKLGSDIDGEAASDLSGFSVSLSNDGTRVAVGAPNNDGAGSEAGHVRIYEYSSGSWIQLGADIDGEAAGDRSGASVSLSDSTKLAIGAYDNDGNGSNAGHVRVYEYSSGSWIQLGADIDGEAVNDKSGRSVSISSDGARVAIGALNNDGAGSEAGHVRVYEYSSGSWTQLGADIDGEAADDRSGFSVSLSDTTRVAIGAYNNDGSGSNAGHVRVYSLPNIVVCDVYDTLNINVFDTIAVFDTISVFDTTYINVHDTILVTQIDTVYLTVTDTLIIDVSLIGINPPTFEYQVLVYPNPTNSYLYVDVPQSMISQSYSMEIKNSIGQSMFGIAINQPQIQINFNSLGAAGSYTLSIKDSGGNVVDTRVIILQ